MNIILLVALFGRLATTRAGRGSPSGCGSASASTGRARSSPTCSGTSPYIAAPSASRRKAAARRWFAC